MKRKALSIRQPYAEQILIGKKTIEYRTTPTHFRGTVYIYASKKFAVGFSSLDSKGFEMGVIVGTVDIVDCKDYGYRDYEWILENPKRLKRPLKPKGKPQPIFFYPF